MSNVWEVEVGIRRPPFGDTTVFVTVAADNWIKAEQTAIAMATIQHRNGVQTMMPVSTTITDWP